MSENTERILDFSPIYKKRGRPKMNPEEKKPRQRKTNKQQPPTNPDSQQQQDQEDQPLKIVDELQKKVQKLAVLKAQWNDYYKRNRERILKRKKELRESKERIVNETLGMQKQEHRGRKQKEINIERVQKMKCLQ